MRTRTVQNFSFLAFAGLVTIAAVWLVLPYYGAILWAIILAILFRPLNQFLNHRLGGRRNLSASLTLLTCIFLVVIPGTAVLTAFAQESMVLYMRIMTRQFDPAAMVDHVRSMLPETLLEILSFFQLEDYSVMKARLTSLVAQSAQAVANQVLLIGQGTARFFLSLGIMLYLLFFLFRDGEEIAAQLRKASPLKSGHTEHIVTKFVAVVRATVQGNFIIAAIQGAIGGLTFAALGIEASVLWGVVMGVLSLLPAVGAFLVWAPVAIWFMMTGEMMKGLILAGIGTFIISTVDYVLRPTLVSKRTRLPDYAILISTMGGLSLMGVNGFIVGPLIAALFVSVWSIFNTDTMQEAASSRILARPHGRTPSAEAPEPERQSMGPNQSSTLVLPPKDAPFP